MTNTRPQVWAHRGASAYCPENTLPSFQRAIELGADGVELDIQLTRDGEIVVCHDEKIDRTSNGSGYIRDYTLSELGEFDFSYDKTDHPDTGIPTMREVFQLLQPTDLTLSIELKTNKIYYEGIEEKILDLTREFGMQERVIYSSFNHYSLRRLQELDPTVKIGFLYGSTMLDMAEYAIRNGAVALHPSLAVMKYPGFMEECKEAGVDVNVWTVDKKSDLLLCKELGVHAVITNRPDMAKQILE